MGSRCGLVSGVIPFDVDKPGVEVARQVCDLILAIFVHGALRSSSIDMTGHVKS